MIRRILKVLAIIAMIALVVWGIFAFGQYAGRAYRAQLARISSTPAPTETVVEDEAPASAGPTVERSFSLDGCAIPAEGRYLAVSESRTSGLCVYYLVEDLVSEETESEDEGLVEVAGDGALLLNLSDPNRTPEFVLEPETGVIISMDPGAVLSGTEEIVSSDEGMLISIYNSTEESLEFSLETGWNTENQRHNVHAVSFSGNATQVFDRASEWQGTPASVSGEHKPIFSLFVIDDTGVVDVTP